MVSLRNIELKISQWSKVISLVGLMGLLCLSLLTVGAVLLRAVFGISILGIYDVSELIVVVVVASCFPLASIRRGHVAVKVLGTKLGERPTHLFNAFSALISLVFFAFLSRQLWNYVSEIMATGENTWIVHIPFYPWWIVGSILITLCIPLELICFFRSIGAVVNPETIQTKTNTDALDKNL